MKNLSRGNLYYQIQNKPLTVCEKDVAALLDRARQDPRLMEVLTEFIRDFWWMLEPRILNKSCRGAVFPFMIKAVVACILDHCEFQNDDRIQFSEWMKKVVAGIQDPNPQFLYMAVFPILSKAAAREVEESLDCFSRHGLYAKDLPFNKGKAGQLKTEKNPPMFKLDEIDLLKLKYIRKIKSMKSDFHMSNVEIMEKTGINRVFLSKILNHKTDNISLEYLRNHTARI